MHAFSGEGGKCMHFAKVLKNACILAWEEFLHAFHGRKPKNTCIAAETPFKEPSASSSTKKPHLPQPNADHS
jgi:hypothetical protein